MIPPVLDLTLDRLRDVRPMLEPNVAMPGAILQRTIMNGVEAGLPLEDALAQAVAEDARIVGGAMPPAVRADTS